MTERKSRGSTGTNVEKKKQMCNFRMPWIFGMFPKAVKKFLFFYQSSMLFLM